MGYYSKLTKEMNNQSITKHGGNLDVTNQRSQSEKSNTLWFQLHDIQEKVKPQRQEKDW